MSKVFLYPNPSPRRMFHAYLASPYSHESSAVRTRRFQDVAKCAAFYMRKGFIIFCPITHSHPIQEYGTPGGWEFWRQVDETALANCEQLWVLCIEGWRESEGVKAEIQFALDNDIPIQYIQPFGTSKDWGGLRYVKTPFVPLNNDAMLKQVREAIAEISGRPNTGGPTDDRFGDFVDLLKGCGFLDDLALEPKKEEGDER